MLACRHRPEVYRVLAEHAPKGKPGPKPINARAGVIFDRRSSGLRTTVLSARLAQEHPEHYDAYRRGETWGRPPVACPYPLVGGWVDRGRDRPLWGIVVRS
jgi:hypothetical protein